MTDKYRYQGQEVTLINHDEHSTAVTIRLPDGTEKTVSKDEITVEPTQERVTEGPPDAAAEVEEPKAS